MDYEAEFHEAKRYCETKLYRSSDYEEVWDLFVRSQLAVSFGAFCAAIGNSRRVRLTDGRSR